MSYANSKGRQDNSYGKEARDAAIWTKPEQMFLERFGQAVDLSGRMA